MKQPEVCGCLYYTSMRWDTPTAYNYQALCRHIPFGGFDSRATPDNTTLLPNAFRVP